MKFVDELRDLALDHPDKPYLREAADEIEQLTRDLKASRQDNGAVIAQLQNDIREARTVVIPGLEEAIRVLRADSRPTAVQLHPEALAMVDERARAAGVSRESAVSAILIAALTEVPGRGRWFK